MKRLVLFFFLFATLALPLQASVVISGKVIPPKGQSAAGVNVVLLEQNPKKAPRGPIAMVKADANGSYQITLIESDPDSTYTVGSRIGENRGGSKAFKISGRESKKQINVDLSVAKTAGANPHEKTPHSQTVTSVKGRFIVKGQVTTPPGVNRQGLSIVLVELDMAQRRQNQVMMRKTDAQGKYRFDLSEMTPSYKYQLGTKAGRQMVGSKMFTFTGKSSRITANIDVPAVTESTEDIVFTHMSSFFELGDGKITITEFLDYSNLGQNMVDSFNNPITKQLPTEATNFQAPGQGGFEITAEGGMVAIKGLFPIGGNRIQFTYDIPLSSGSFTIEQGVFTGTEQITLIKTSNAFQTDFARATGKITETKQSHQQEAYYIKKMDGEAGPTVQVQIHGMPTPQKNLAYPATFLMIFLLTGLFWYLKVKPSRKQA